eukprot:5008140-Pyramimonas_sp.AAC.1
MSLDVLEPTLQGFSSKSVIGMMRVQSDMEARIQIYCASARCARQDSARRLSGQWQMVGSRESEHLEIVGAGIDAHGRQVVIGWAFNVDLLIYP